MSDSGALSSPIANELAKKISDRKVVIGIMGLGYVGLPLAIAFCEKGLSVIGFDIDEEKPRQINQGRSYLKTVASEAVAKAVEQGSLKATSSPEVIADVDVIVICVPTPLNKYREPDLSYVENTVTLAAKYLKKGQIVSLESTTYPGTTDEVIRPVIEATGLKTGEDVFLVYSPEREDPGNTQYSTSTTPKIVGGETSDALRLGCMFYELVVGEVVPVSSLATAEAVKLTENIFRAVNISLVNELKVTFEKMGINIWEVIEAAKTKPFGFMPFYPGPGLGGHCIPIDPFYLTWKAREYGVATRFIELAGEINNSMPDYVVMRLREALDMNLAKGLRRSKILLVGVAYKKNIDDTRESPALLILRKLKEAGADVAYYDPYVSVIPKTREYPELMGMQSIGDGDLAAGGFDAALICTDHDVIDFSRLVDSCKIVVDTRNATKDVSEHRDRIVRA
ncbi:nucleotide sugar dehydrogenase [Pseudohalioglobus sediminis]|uniref:Nucleotide sugar dehydrogenase n=1 Tax=Pseudohalioglobus sediminis TaxID=2606449 RepID=A0A5B0WSR8_9GAMM|nr:nucleotide sugar dehydrogenase [Pseudohalioglobus sediminis]KAA1189956.1 nucleotide sugar dehydrogenase [Pseudohalioglobus sediminis]